jgi:hypothetical protein
MFYIQMVLLLLFLKNQFLPMNSKQKDLIWLLMQADHYIIKTINANGKEVYKILEGRQIPVQYFTEITVRNIKNYLKIDGQKRMTLNLNEVRKLHGNNYIKIIYKKAR